MSTIKSISAREILDSTGIPTVEVSVVLDDGSVGISSVPSAIKTSSYEAVEIRDTDSTHYGGSGVSKTVTAVSSTIAPKLTGMEAASQALIDRAMIDLDGTPNKGHLGVNAVLPVSQAVAKASAISHHMPLYAYLRQFLSRQDLAMAVPRPMFALIEGGEHSVNGIDFQEILLIPASSKTYSESLEGGVRVFQSLKKSLRERNLATLVSNEGGFAPSFATNRDALNFLKLAMENSGVKFSLDAFFGIDCAADFFRRDKMYYLKDRGGNYATEELVDFYKSFVSEFGILYLEDPFADDDWDAWKKLYSILGEKITIAGDDLTATNPYRVQMALEHQVLNAMVIKPQQIGTITEAIAVAEIARFKNLKMVVADRSSQTSDDFMADFAVAIGADFVKFGAPIRERTTKYNRLLQIEQEIKPH